MKTSRLVACLAVVLLAMPAWGSRGTPKPKGGTVRGKVTLAPAPPPRPPRPSRYPGEKPGPTEYRRGPAVVFIDGPTGSWTPGRAVMEQKDRQYSPLAMPVLVGTTIEFPNRDNEYHQVFSNSGPKKDMDLGRYPPGETRSETFDKPGLARLRCDIHKHMHAAILVLPNPFFAICGEDGSFEIKDVPAGSWKISVYQENYEPKEPAKDPMRPKTQDLTVKDGTETRVDFDLR